MELRDILYEESGVQDAGLEGPCEVYEIEIAAVATEYVREVKVSMAIIRVVEFFYKFGQLHDEIPSQLQVFGCGRGAETTGEFSLQGLGVGYFFSDYKAFLLEEGAPLLAVRNNFCSIYAHRGQLVCRFELAGGTASSAVMGKPVLELDPDRRGVVAF